MSRVHIITDSTAHFPDPTLSDRLGVTVVPQAIQFGRQIYREDVDISAEEFFLRLQHYGALPALHSPTADAFRELYAEKFRQNKQILSIHISGKMSETVAQNEFAAPPLGWSGCTHGATPDTDKKPTARPDLAANHSYNR